jgi:pimeloyl-ACP methyl ester carboxylesterase
MTIFKLAGMWNGFVRAFLASVLNLFSLYMYTAMPEKINMLKVRFWNNRIKLNYHTVLKSSDRTNDVNCMSVIGNFKAFCPHGQSIHAMEHVCQLNTKGDAGYLRKFDYGKKKNLQKYGSKIPPSYELGQIETPIALYYGTGDRYITEENMELLRSKLSSTTVETKVLEDWGHGTFILGKYMGEFYRNIARTHLLPSTLA